MPEVKSIQCGWNALSFPLKAKETELVMRSGGEVRVK